MERWGNSQRCLVKGWRGLLHPAQVTSSSLDQIERQTTVNILKLQKHRKAPKIKPPTPPSLLIAANSLMSWCHRPLSLLTPLHVASEKAHNDVLEVLLKHEAKVSFSKPKTVWTTNQCENCRNCSTSSTVSEKSFRYNVSSFLHPSKIQRWEVMKHKYFVTVLQ